LASGSNLEGRMNSMIGRILCVAAALGASPVLSAGQTPAQRIDVVLERALGAGVPIELLESKVAEGRAKGIPLDRIAQVVEARFETLERVRGAVGIPHALSPEELGVAADAVLAGVSEAALGALSERAPRDRRAVAIATLTQLVQLGHASDIALERVSEALQRGPEALMNLPAQASARGGGPPGIPPGQGPGAQNGRGGPPAAVPPAGARGRGRGPGGPPGED
jgi:hypothetical protein